MPDRILGDEIAPGAAIQASSVVDHHNVPWRHLIEVAGHVVRGPGDRSALNGESVPNDRLGGTAQWRDAEALAGKTEPIERSETFGVSNPANRATSP